VTGTKLRIENWTPMRVYIDGKREYGVHSIEDKTLVMEMYSVSPRKYAEVEIEGEIEVEVDENGWKSVNIVKARELYANDGFNNENDTV
jgi:hypothetical protein